TFAPTMASPGGQQCMLLHCVAPSVCVVVGQSLQTAMSERRPTDGPAPSVETVTVSDPAAGTFATDHRPVRVRSVPYAPPEMRAKSPGWKSYDAERRKP